MKYISEMSVGEIAAYVAEHLRRSSINGLLMKQVSEPAI